MGLQRIYGFCRILFLAGGLAAGMNSASAAEQEDLTARYQLTYNWQKHPAFAAAYSGANSIVSSAEEMYTFSATAFLGMRPWQGGELSPTPEIACGVPFSNNRVGLRGFSNGAINRAARSFFCVRLGITAAAVSMSSRG